MSEYSPRPIGTTFEEITETSTERVITTLHVVAHQLGADGQLYEIIHEVGEIRQPKRIPGGQERK